MSFEPFGSGPEYGDTFKNPTADLGSGVAFDSALVESFKAGFGNQAYVFSADRLRDQWAKLNDETPVSKDTFARNYSMGGRLKWYDGMSRGTADDLLTRTLESDVRGRQIGPNHAMAALAGGLAGGILDPANLAVAIALPESAVMNISRGASVAARASTALRVFDMSVNAGVSGIRDAMLTEIPNAIISEENQQPYAYSDFLMNLGASGIAGAGLHASIGGVKAKLRPELDALMARVFMAKKLNGEDTAGLGHLLNSMDPATRAAAEQAQAVGSATARQASGDDTVILMTGRLDPEREGKFPTTGPEVKTAPRLSESEISRRKAVAKLLATDPSTRAVGATPDELFMQQVWKGLFGTDVRFIDAKMADKFGVHGFVQKTDPNTIYVRSGVFGDGDTPFSMAYIAGHEVAHTIRLRDTDMWMRMVGAMMKSGDEPLAQAYEALVRRMNDRAAWVSMSAEGKMDEVFANVFGQALVSRNFWQALDKQTAGTLRAWIDDAIATITRSPSTSRTATDLYRALGEMTVAADEAGITLASRKGLDPRYSSLDALYAPVRQSVRDRLNRVSRLFNSKEARAIADLDRIVDDLSSSNEGVYQDYSAGSNRDGSRFVREYRNRTIPDGVSVEHYILKTVLNNLARGSEDMRKVADAYFKGLLGDAKTALRDKLTPLVVAKRNADGTYDFIVLRNDDFPKWYEVGDDPFSTFEQEAMSAFMNEHFEKVRNLLDEYLTTRKGEARSLRSRSEHFNDYLHQLEAEDIQNLILEGDVDAFWTDYREFLIDRANSALSRMATEDETKAAARLYDAYKKRAKMDGPDGAADTAPKMSFSEWLADHQEASGSLRVWAVVTDDIDRIEGIIKQDDSLPFSDRASAEELKQATKEWMKEFPKDYRKNLAETAKDMNYPPTDFRSPTFIGPREDATLATERYTQDWEAARIGIEDRLRDEIESSLAAMEGNPAFDHMASTLKAALKQLDRMEGTVAKMIDALAHEELINSGLYPNYEKLMQVEALIDTELGDHFTMQGLHAKGEASPLDTEFASRPRMEIDTEDVSLMASGEGGTEAFARVQEALAEGEKARRFTFATKAKRMAENLKLYGAYVGDVAAIHQTAIKARLDELGIPDVTDPSKIAEGIWSETDKPTARQSAIVDRLLAIRDKGLMSARHLDNYLSGSLSKDDFYARYPDVLDTYEWHLRDKADSAEARRATVEDIRARTYADMVGDLNTERAQFNYTSLARKGLNWVYSKLDGHRRVDVTSGAGDSVPRHIQARQDEIITAFHLTLEQAGLMEAWRSDALLPRDQRVVPQVLAAMLGDERITDPAIKALAQTIKDLNTTVTGMLNKAGATIRPLDNYLFSTSHNGMKIHAQGFEAWSAFVRQHADWARIEKSNGIGSTKAAHDLYLSTVYKEITSERERLPQNFDEIVRLGNMANSVSRRRTIHWKGTAAYDYDLQFGSGNPAGHIVADWAQDVHRAVLMEEFGNKPRDTFTKLVPMLTLASDPSAHFGAADMNAGIGAVMRVGKEKLLSAVGLNKVRRIKGTFDHLMGDLNNPLNRTTAENGKAWRNLAFSATGWTSGIASMTDQGGIISSLRWIGGRKGFGREKEYAAALKRIASSKEGREWMLGQGAAMQAFLTAYSKTTVMDSGIYSFAGAAADATFKYSGLDFSTQVSQMAMHDVMQQILGDMSVNKLTPQEKIEFDNWRNHFGITESEFATMLESAQAVPGLPGVRLAPDLIPDSALRQKLSVAMHETVGYGVLEPSESTKAHLTFYTKAGTKNGEVIRSIAQYKSYPMTVMTKVLSRFDNGYTGWSSPMLERLIWAGMLMSLATGVLAMKDVLRGNDPFNPFDTDQWSMGNLHRWFVQAGAGPLAAIDQFTSIQGILGPSVGAAYGIGEAALTGNGYSLTNRTLSILPMASLGPVNEAQKAIIAELSDSYDIKRRQVWAWQLAETGRGKIWNDD